MEVLVWKESQAKTTRLATGYMFHREVVGIAFAVPTLVFGSDNGGEMSK